MFKIHRSLLIKYYFLHAEAAPPSSDTESMQPAFPSAGNLSDVSMSTDNLAATATARQGGDGATSSAAAAVPTAQGPLKGTAAGGKWSEYASIKAVPSLYRKKRPLNAAERLQAAIASTAWLRLLLAIVQGLLLFAAWNLAEYPVPGGWALSRQERTLRKIGRAHV